VQIVTVTTDIDGCQVTFGTEFTGTAPYTWEWDFGAWGTSTATNPLVDFGASGTYPFTLTAANDCGDDTWADEVTVECTLPCTEVSGVDLTVVTTGTIYPNDPVDFSADIMPDDFTAPYSYTIDYGDGSVPFSGSDSADPLPFTYSYTAVGTYTVEIAVWNCAMQQPVVDTVVVTVREPGTCVDLTQITIAGPMSGEPGVYNFTSSYLPQDATPPIAYLWDNGDTTAGTIRTLGVGTHTLVVTATNCTSALVTDTHTIVITAPSYAIYLPVVYRMP
jgi:PKD repeat protein